MDFSEFQHFFTKALQENSISPLTDAQIETFYSFTMHLMEVNQTTNLTAIRNVPDVIYKHLIDSLTVSAMIPQGATLLDLGCGPGFPSIPLAIARPDLKITALDSTAKKIAFLNETASLLGLTNLKGHAGRAEDAKIAAQIGRFDIVTARAVARLNILAELCLPYVKIGGTMLAMKSAKAPEELLEATNCIKILGGTFLKDRSFGLLREDSDPEPRTIIAIQKTAPTPSKYPRPYAAILKKPL